MFLFLVFFVVSLRHVALFCRHVAFFPPPRGLRRFRRLVARLGPLLPRCAVYSWAARRPSRSPSAFSPRSPAAFVRHAWRLVWVEYLVWAVPMCPLVGFFSADPALWRRWFAPIRCRRGVPLCSAWLGVAATSGVFDSVFRAPGAVLRCAQRLSLCSAASRSCLWSPCVARLFLPFHGGAWRLISALAPSAWRTVLSFCRPPRGGLRSPGSSLKCSEPLSAFPCLVAQARPFSGSASAHYCPTFSAPQQHLRVWGTRWRGRREQLHQWTAVEQVELENS